MMRVDLLFDSRVQTLRFMYNMDEYHILTDRWEYGLITLQSDKASHG